MSISISSNNSSLANSFSPKRQHTGLLRPVHNNYYNNLDLNNFTSITNEESADIIRDSLNNTLFLNNIDEQYANSNNNNANTSNNNDINPRKHSPGLYINFLKV